MYKRFSLQDIQSIKNDVIPRMTRILQNEKYQSIKDYYKHGFKEWNTICYLNRWEPTMRMIREAPGLHIIDEVEKIELLLDEEQIGNLQSLVKKYMIKPTSIKSTMTIEKILMEECKKWTLALISWLTEFIPYIGPLLWGIPAWLLALTHYGLWGFGIIFILYWFIQWTENNILIPYVMNKTLGLSPIVIFLCVLLGGLVLGFVGVVIGVPLAVIITMIYDDNE